MIGLHHLPALNAGLNGLSAIWLILGLVSIRRGRRAAHRVFMLLALGTSCLFLVSYLIYHSQVGTTSFASEGWIRPVYFVILITHSVLAVVIVPMVLITLSRALRGRFAKHRRIARLTWPLWMIVSVTGVLIYVLLYHVDRRPPERALDAPSALAPDGGRRTPAGPAGPARSFTASTRHASGSRMTPLQRYRSCFGRTVG